MNSQTALLRDLDRYKWNEEFCCLKCGNREYIPGKQPYSRRCKSCKYDESLFKSTAFEGIRFSIEKAINVLEYIVENCFVDPDAKIIQIGGKKKGDIVEDLEFFEFEEEAKEPKMISMMEYIDMSRERKIDEDFINRRLMKTFGQHSIKVSKIAQEFELEENTVNKLFDRISNRIRLDDEPESTSLNRVLSYLNYHPERRSLSYLLGMMMIPLPGEWHYGEKEVGANVYQLSFVFDSWKIHPIAPKPFCYEDIEVIYGSDKWAELFVEK
jgi:hypothetical protein